MADIQFQNVSKERKSEVRNHFLHNKAQKTPTCNLCSASILKAGGSST